MPVLTSWSRAVSVAVAVALLSSSACGVEHRDDALAPGASPGTGSGTGSSAATSALISAADLPAGFADSGGQSAGYRQQVCGVDLEPSAPARTASARFSQGPVGPFVEQRVRVYADDTASSVMARLRTALAGCDQYDLAATASAPAASVAVEPLDLPQLGDESVGWRQVARSELPITTDVVLIRRGRTIVLVTSYALKAPPPTSTIEQAATAAADRLGA